ncbi:pyroglutamyl-peptidase I [Oceanobacillus sp. FSL H7-0719]|uniref:pyroglutamyl-peptidase I n=1 Tax=Oceanobacillus sp. FSL H7-0719 TaxID=2954507 RepID=UPI00324C23D8
MKRLLLTGFEPFLKHPVNPTENIVKKLNGEQINGYQIISEILPVEFSKSGNRFVELLKIHQPDAVISLGLAAGRDRITPERIAINCNDGPVDNQGYKPNGEKIFESGPDGYFSNLPLQRMVKTLKEQGLPAKISNTAGAYLCNNVMYHGLHYFSEQQQDVPSGFIHIPASHQLAVDSNIPSWSDADLLRAVQLAIACL